MNRIKRISMQLLERYGELFSTDFDKNKEVLGTVAVFRSKGLRNEVAGHITNYLKAGMDGKRGEEEAPESTIAEEDQEGE